MSQNGDLDKGLLNKIRSFFRYFQRQKLLSFMVKDFDHLSKWPLVDRLDNFVAIGDVIP
jgi:hypothetical protein